MNTTASEQAMEVSTFSEENQAGASILSNEDTGNTNNEEAPSTPNNTPTITTDTDNPSPSEHEEGQGENKAKGDDVPAPGTQQEAEAALKTVGLDIREFETEFMANGELSEASYDKLVKAGIPRTMVDSYIRGQEALAEKTIHDVHAIAGGSEGYASMVEWARENLSAQEIETFDHVMASGNKELIVLAVTGVVSRWKSATGSAPKKVVQGRVSPMRSGGGFETLEEQNRALQDRRYGNDARYTRMVEEKMMRSSF